MAFKREKVVRNAEKYVSRGKIEAAIKEYMKVLKEFPNEAGTLNRVGDLYARIDKDDDAIRLFTQIAEQYSSEGFLVKAIAIYKKILRLDPARLAVYERLGGLYYHQGLINEARGQYQVLADHYLKNNDSASAINIYQRMSEIEPENPSHHLKLAELYQQMQLWDQAMESYDAIAVLMLQHDRIEEASRVYQRALEVHSSDLEFIQTAVRRLRTAGGPGPAARLLAMATELNPRAQSIAETMRPDTGQFDLPTAEEIDQAGVESAELQVVEVTDSSDELQSLEAVAIVEPTAEDGGIDDSAVLELDLDAPDLGDLQGVEIEGIAAGGPEVEVSIEEVDLVSVDSPAEPELSRDEATAQEEAIEGVAFAMDTADDLAVPAESEPADDDFGSSDELEFDLELDLDLEIDEDEPALASSEPPATPVEPEPEPEPEPAPPSVSPDDLVAEAEVFAKYGLTAKAEERVASVLADYPDLLSARQLQIQLRLQEGDREELRDLATAFRELVNREGQSELWEAVAPDLAAVGIVLATEEAAEVEIEVPPPPPPEPKKERVSKLLEALEEPVVPRRRGATLDIDAALAELATGVTSKKRKPKKSAVDDLMAEAGLLGEKAAEATTAPPTAESSPTAAGDVPPSELPTQQLEPVEPPVSEPEPLAAAATAEETAAPLGVDAGAPPEAPWVDGELPSLEDDDLDLELDGFKLPEERPLEAPALDDSAMNWLDEIPPQPAVEAAESSLFDGEDEFFDLAAELEQELGQEDAESLAGDIVTQPEEPSLEDIVEGFKRGVAENLSAEDYGTHYNLGIAYREMGLLDEAIGEFQLASKDPAHLVECCSMLGICFSEKGLYDLAVKWYKRGLEAPDLAEDTMLSLLYDMGDAYQSLGDEAAARKTFNELSGFNIGFRDVVDRIEALGG